MLRSTVKTVWYKCKARFHPKTNFGLANTGSNLYTQNMEEANVTKSNEAIRAALNKIKRHITFEAIEINAQNRDLHQAILIIVEEFRKVGRLQ